MKLTRDEKKVLYEIVDSGLEDALSIRLNKGKKKRTLDIFLRFCMLKEASGAFTSSEEALEAFAEYVDVCSKAFANWVEAAEYNWQGYLAQDKRQSSFLVKLKPSAKKVAGIKTEDAWDF